MTKFRSHYESLNVTRDAPAEVIRAAYRSLSQKHHPDKHSGDPEAEQVMARLNSAYSVLSHARRRELYDAQLDSGPHPGAYHDTSDELADARNPAAATVQPPGSPGALLALVRRYATGRDGRIAAMVLAASFLLLIPVLWFVWQDHQSMLLLEHAAIYTPVPVAVRAPASISAPASIPPPALAKAATEDATKAAPAPELADATAKRSDYDRLSAMLKSMGLGLHKLDAPEPATKIKPAGVPAKPAETDSGAVLAKAHPAATARAPEARPAEPDVPRGREEAERSLAAEPARADTKAPAEASHASTSTGASAIGATSAAGAPPRPAVVADARACVPPAYPPNAHRNGETGTVQLALLVGSDGRVMESAVQSSSASSELDRAARKALSQCRFKTPGNNPQADPVWTRMEYVFSIE